MIPSLRRGLLFPWWCWWIGLENFLFGWIIFWAYVSYRTQNPDTPKEEEKTEEELKAQEEAGKSTWLNFSLFCLDNEYLKPNWDESVDRFDDMGLKEEVLRGIYGYGFNKPSPIQQKGILPVIQGHDTIA